jgi:tripartite-type tricarboxylate transporter receptor subunit TctC
MRTIITRRRLAGLGAALPLSTLAANRASAQAYPARPITCIVAYGPGTGTDLLARQIEELVRHGRANPDKLNFGSPGAGASAHLAGETFKAAAGFGMTHVPYNNNQLFADLLSGVVSLSFYPYLTLKPHIETGALIPLATTGASRSPWLPELPTMVELGYPDMVFTSWFGLYGPAGLAEQATSTLAEAARRALLDPELRSAMAESATRIEYGGPRELAEFTASEIDRYKPIIARAGGPVG